MSLTAIFTPQETLQTDEDRNKCNNIKSITIKPDITIFTCTLDSRDSVDLRRIFNKEIKITIKELCNIYSEEVLCIPRGETLRALDALIEKGPEKHSSQQYDLLTRMREILPHMG